MKKMILMLAMLIFTGITLVACAGGTLSESVPSSDSTLIESTYSTEETMEGNEDPDTGAQTSDTPTSTIVDIDVVKAEINGSWEIEYGNSRITISEDSRFEINWDNMTIINGQYSIIRNSETDYRLTLLPDRVRNISLNQPAYGSPHFDDEEQDSSPNWIQPEIIIDPSNRNRLGFVGYDGTVEWVNIRFTPEVLWLEDRM